MKKFIPVLMAFLFAIAFACSFALSAAQVNAQDNTPPECTSLEGSNINVNDLFVYSVPVRSYLISTNNQFMRVQGYSKRGDFNVVYYDQDFKTVSRLDIEAELPIFGGFYAFGGNYYIVSGSKNEDESDDVEVYRITKYDSDWNRIGSCSLFGANTYIPFDAGSCRMTHSGNSLVIRTCHEMYEASDGRHHQANVTIVVDTASMSITDSAYRVAGSKYGYASHSFNQYVKTDGNTIAAVDHGDANPRAVLLNKFSLDSSSSQGAVRVLSFAGDSTNNYTGASVGGLEVSDSSYLIAGNSVVQDSNYNRYKTRNIFVAAVNKSSNDVTVNWLTDLAEGSGTACTPHIVKAGSNQFMVLWYQGDEVKYVLVNGNGAAVSEVYSLDGNLSDCAPILDNGSVVWYTWKDTKETFYKIPVSNPGNAEKHEVVKGHLFELNSVENGLADVTCKRCGYHTTAKVPTSFSVWWSKPSLSSASISTDYIPVDLEAGGVASYEIDSIGYSASADLALNDFVLESSDPENCVIDEDNQLVTFLKGGNYTVTVYPKYNPTKKRTFSVYILMPIESVELTSSTAGPAAPGSQVTLSAAVTGGKGKLEYEYYVIDSNGNETLIQEKSTSKKCYWTPEEPGDYKFRVDVTDPGDNNNKVSSNEINYRVHDYEWQGTEDGLATLKCKTCGDEITGKVPTSFYVYWTEASGGWTSLQLPSGMEPGSEVTYRFTSVSYTAQSDLALNVFEVEASDPDNCIIDTDNRKIQFNKGGNYTITVYPRYNPTLKKNYSVYILKPIDSVELTSSTTGPAAPGSRVTLRTTVDGGKGTLEYEYYVIDSEGNETLIEEKSTRNYCYWTPEEPGEYKFRVDVTDPGDDNNKVSSNELDYLVHDYEWQKTEDGLATLKCKTCGDEITGKVPTSFTVWWSQPSSSVSSSSIPSGMEPGSVVTYRTSNIRYSAESDLALNEFVFESSDPENCIIDAAQRTVTFNKGGNYTITAYPKYNPSLKQNYPVYILKSVEGVTLTASKTELQQPGSGILLEAAVDGGKGTLEYEFFVIDSEGNETLIREKGTRDYCYWTPQESGNFKLCVDVTDTGDDNNKVRSNLVDFHVHDYQWEKTEDGIATLKCAYCEKRKTGRVPTGFYVFWRKAANGGYYSSSVPTGLEVGEAVDYYVPPDYITYSAESDSTFGGFTVESDRPDDCSISGTRITFNKAGTFILTAYPTYNPEVKKTYSIRVVKTLEGVTLETEPSDQQEFGRTVKLIAIPDGGRGTVKYTFTQIDGAGNAKTLATDITTPQYTWTAPAAGSYKLKVQAKDTGDDNRTVTSEEVDYTITKAPHPTVMPKEQYTVPFTVSQVSDDIIADAAGWAFDEADLGTELAEGETAQFTVHYVGADAGNFENLDAVIKVKRAECTHGLANMVAHQATPFTCEEDGNDPYWQCSLCKRYFSDEDAQNEIPEGSWIISAHHMLTELAANDPTCEATGNIHCWQCDVCSKYFEDEDGLFGLTDEEVIVPATGHDWGEWQETEDVSTCVHAGQLMRVCGNDPAHIEYKAADLLAHDMIETAGVPATCEEPGNIQYWQCKNCENYFKDAEGTQQIGEADLVLPPLGHDYDLKNGTVTTPATCTEQGVITYTCTHDAGHKITDVLPALGHKWNSGVITTAPTATKKGVKTFTCTRCGGTRTESLPARNNQVAADGTKVGAGASEEVANKAITTITNDKDPAGSAFGLLKVKSTKQTKTSVTVTWSKVKGAKKYVVYGNTCGKTKLKKLATIKSNSFVAKKVINNKGKKVKVKKGTYYKFIIVALNGNRDVVSTSKIIHVATKGGKVGNDKSVTTKAKKNKVTVKVGKTFALKAKAIPASKKLKVKRHRVIAYESSNKAIATVSAKGVIKGKKKGTCYVYAYAQDGICKKVTVTVK